MIVCSRCKEAKTEDNFYKHPSIKPDGVRKKCNSCRNAYRRSAHAKNPSIVSNQKKMWAKNNREHVAKKAREYRAKNPLKFKSYSLMKDFGITLEQFNAMLISQNYVCKICGQPELSRHQNGKTKDLAVDHRHKTDKVRGLLCWRCNTGIGKLLDSPELLRRAAEYVDKDGAI